VHTKPGERRQEEGGMGWVGGKIGQGANILVIGADRQIHVHLIQTDRARADR
jgi:hypothetical protein